jgi:cytoskeleton protein RodZ
MSAVISDQQSGPSVAEFFSPGPGERLRAARLSKGFDLGKIASELHLTNAVVERLEADDYDDVGARVFVRGYLRNYARIVEVPVDSILRQFDEKWPDDRARQSMLRESPRLPPDGRGSRGWASAVTWVLVLGAVALFLMWWRGYLDDLVPVEMRATSSATEMTGAIEEPAPAAGIDDGLPTLDGPGEGGLVLPPRVDEPVGGEGPALPTLLDATSIPPGGGLAADSASGDSPGTAPTDVAAADEGPAGPLDAVEPAVGAAPASADGEGQAAAVDPAAATGDGIVMTFSAPCWVDVRDSTRKFKLFGEMPKDARRVLGGEPPYQMVIGNARAVTIEVDGEPFDITPYANGNVARFTLDP